MSILDFTTGLFRDPANLRAFVDDPDQALDDAGLSSATPEQVHDLLPMVAESMPPDHPQQAVAHSDDPATALRALDFDELTGDPRDHHQQSQLIDKALADVPGADDDESVEHIDIGNYEVGAEPEKGLGEGVEDSVTPAIEAGVEADDDYLECCVDDGPGDDDAVADDLVGPDFDSVSWAKDID